VSIFLLIEEPKHALRQLTASPAGNDLDEPSLLLDDFAKRVIDVVAAINNFVQIECCLDDWFLLQPNVLFSN
jgi:hypothetical protein